MGRRARALLTPTSRGSSSGLVLKPTPHVSGLSYDSVEIFGHPVPPSTPNGWHIKVRKYS